mgnify:CR=1 FL=1
MGDKEKQVVRPIEEVLSDLAKEVPIEEWDKLPEDLNELKSCIPFNPSTHLLISSIFRSQSTCQEKSLRKIFGSFLFHTRYSYALLFALYLE